MKTLYLLLLFICLGSACSPIHVVRLEPAEPESSSRLLYGNAVISQWLGDVRVDVNYYDASNDYLIFNLEIENQSDAAFDFNPAEITLSTDLGDTQSAIDPELQLLSMDLDDARRRQNQRTMGWVSGSLLVLGTAASIISETADRPEVAIDNAIIADASFDLAQSLTFLTIDANNRSIRYQLPPEEEIPTPDSRFFWLDHSLRVTTVRPGEVVMGKIAFRRVDKATRFTVEVPLQGQRLSYEFRQRVFRP
jgi:hypothetical protein